MRGEAMRGGSPPANVSPARVGVNVCIGRGLEGNPAESGHRSEEGDMPLSPDEQYLLDAIETGLRNQDPAFATKLTDPDADQARRRSTLIAHACLWLGMSLSLTGFGLVHEMPIAGGLLILYGTVILIYAIVRIVLLRQPASRLPDHE
jgi:hypothetical protein